MHDLPGCTSCNGVRDDGVSRTGSPVIKDECVLSDQDTSRRIANHPNHADISRKTDGLSCTGGHINECGCYIKGWARFKQAGHAVLSEMWPAGSERPQSKHLVISQCWAGAGQHRGDRTNSEGGGLTCGAGCIGEGSKHAARAQTTFLENLRCQPQNKIQRTLSYSSALGQCDGHMGESSHISSALVSTHCMNINAQVVIHTSWTSEHRGLKHGEQPIFE